MFEIDVLEKLDAQLARIFVLPISRSTFREVQNAVVSSSKGDTDKAKTALDCLLSGSKLEGLELIVDKYSIQTRLSKEIFERGEFVNFVSSEMMSKNESPLFLNRVKRVDGKELEFITDLEANIRLLKHFVIRLKEAKESRIDKKLHQQIKDHIERIKKMLDQI